MSWEEAADRAERLLERLDPKRMEAAEANGTAWLDPLLATKWRVPHGYDRTIRAWLLAVKPTAAHLILATMHADGRIRQRATERLAELGPDVLPALLVRCADWVPEVRVIAEHALREQLPTAGEAVLERIFRVGLRMRTWDRRPNEIFELAAKAINRYPAAVERLRSRSTLPFLDEYDVGLPNEDPDAYLLRLDREYGASQYLERRIRERGSLPHDTIRELLKSRFPKIRALAIDFGFSVLGPDEVEPFLLDRSACVRLSARWQLVQKDDAYEPVDFYRAALPLPTAIRGYAESKAPDAVARLEPLLHHPRARVRLAVLQAIGPRLPVGDIVEMMDDWNRRVAVEAGRALVRSGQRPRLRELMPLAAQGPRIGGGAAARKAARALSLWDRLEFWLSFSMFEQTAEYTTQLNTWLAGRARVPQPETFQRWRCEDLLERCQPILDQRLLDGLAAELRYWRHRDPQDRPEDER